MAMKKSTQKRCDSSADVAAATNIGSGALLDTRGAAVYLLDSNEPVYSDTDAQGVAGLGLGADKPAQLRAAHHLAATHKATAHV